MTDCFTFLEIDETPCVYTGALAPSHDRNLMRISEGVLTRLFFAHIRAAGPGAPVHEFNSHPFKAGRFLFMHNGGIARCTQIRRKMEDSLSEAAYATIQGQTDSELAFAVFLDHIAPGSKRFDIHCTARQLREAMRKTLATIEAATGSLTEHDQSDEPDAACRSSLNFAVTNGETVVVTRFRSGSLDDPPSLYYAASTQPQDPSQHPQLFASPEAGSSPGTIMVASEPVYHHHYDSAAPPWVLIERNTVVSIQPKGAAPRRGWTSRTGLVVVSEMATRGSLREALAAPGRGVRQLGQARL